MSRSPLAGARKGHGSPTGNGISKRASTSSSSNSLKVLAQKIVRSPERIEYGQPERGPLQQLNAGNLPNIAPATPTLVDWPHNTLEAFDSAYSNRFDAGPLDGVPNIENGFSTLQSAYSMPNVGVFEPGNSTPNTSFAYSNTSATYGRGASHPRSANHAIAVYPHPGYNTVADYIHATDYDNTIADYGNDADHNIVAGHSNVATLPTAAGYSNVANHNTIVDYNIANDENSTRSQGLSRRPYSAHPLVDDQLHSFLRDQSLSNNENSETLDAPVASKRGRKIVQKKATIAARLSKKIVATSKVGRVSKSRTPKSPTAQVDGPAASTDTGLLNDPVVTIVRPTGQSGTMSLVLKVKHDKLSEYKFYVQTKFVESQKEMRRQKKDGSTDGQNGSALFPPTNDDTIPNTRMDFDMHVDSLVIAMLDNKNCLEVETEEFTTRWGDGATYYTPAEMRAAVQELISEMIAIHKEGWTKPIHDSDRRALFQKTMFFTFEDRYETIREYFRISKTVCADIMKGERFWALLGNPGELMKRALTNARQNGTRRQRLAWAAAAEKAKKTEKEQKRAREEDERDEKEAGPSKRACKANLGLN